jgi:hypothetical protein
LPILMTSDLTLLLNPPRSAPANASLSNPDSS